MSWAEVVGVWTSEGRWDWLFESLTWMDPDTARPALAALQASPFHPPSPAARQLLQAGELDRLSPWGRPPWQRLLSSGADDLLLSSLDQHYAEILDSLNSPGPERDRLFSVCARPDCPPQLAQLVQDLAWEPAEDEPGWAESCLLSGRPLPPARLLDYLGRPDWKELACRQLAGLSFEVALSLFLRARLSDWHHLPRPRRGLATGLLELAQHYPELHPQVLAALAGEPAAILELWTRTRQRALGRHLLKRGWTTHNPEQKSLLALARGESVESLTPQELEGLQHDPQFYVTVRSELNRRQLKFQDGLDAELRWSALGQQPPGPASRELLELAQEGWRPQHQRALFARLLQVLDGEPIRTFSPHWTSLLETPARRLQLSPAADRLALWVKGGLQIWSYPELKMLGEWKRSKDSQPDEVWFLPEGLLLKHGSNLSRCDHQGQPLWTRGLGQGPLAISPCATRLAQAQGQQLQILSLGPDLTGLLGATDLPEPVISRGPVFVGGWAPQTLAWSPDGSRLATSHKEKIQVWDAGTLSRLYQTEQMGQVSWVGFYDGCLAAGCIDRLGGTILLGLHDTVSLFDPDNGSLLHTFKDLSAVRTVVEDGPRLFVQGEEALYALEGRRELGRLQAKEMQLQEVRDGYARVLFSEKAWLVDARRPERLGRIPEACALAPGLLLALQQGQLQSSPLQADLTPGGDQSLPPGRLQQWVQALQEQA
ncbi:MAG: hypothetical protein U0931_28340 [Vulcanimicrobiota bacterium]